MYKPEQEKTIPTKKTKTTKLIKDGDTVKSMHYASLKVAWCIYLCINKPRFATGDVCMEYSKEIGFIFHIQLMHGGLDPLRRILP